MQLVFLLYKTMDMVGFNDIEPETFNAGFSRIRGYNDKGETRRDDAA